MLKIKSKEILIVSILILIIFGTGFIIRFTNTEMSFLNESEKALFQDEENGIQYFQESDSYYNYRLTLNFFQHGYLGDKKLNGVEWDSYSYYPPGVPLDYPPLITFIAVFVYYVLNIFTDISLIKVCFWLPAFITPLCGVAGFLFVRRIVGNLGGFLTGMLLVTSTMYCFKTVPGFFDTDMFNVVFPIIIFWTIIEAEKAPILKNKVLFAGISGFFLFLFAMAWNGWQYIFYCVVLSALLYYLMGVIKKWDIKEFPFIFTTFLGISLIFIGLTYPLNIYKLLFGPLEYIDVLTSSSNIWYPWPDTYKGVAELQEATINRVLFHIGPLTVLMGIFGMMITFFNEIHISKFKSIFNHKNTLFKKDLYNNKININVNDKSTIDAPITDNKLKKDQKLNLGYFTIFILFIWVITAALSLTKGVRFIILLLPPLTIFSGIVLGFCQEKFNLLHLPFNKAKRSLMVFLIILILVLPQAVATYQTNQFITPAYDDYYDQSAEWIDNNLSNDTVIITDWSYGHFYSAMANRPVSFDGRMGYIETLPTRNIQYASLDLSTDIPNTSRDYWFSMALATNNTTLSRNIFNMLATSGDNAFLVTDKYVNNKTNSKDILNDILGYNKSQAYNTLILKYNFSSVESGEILRYSHPSNTQPSVLITISSMLENGKSIFSTIKNDSEETIYHIYDLPKKYGLKDLHIYESDGKVLWNNKKVYKIFTMKNGTITEKLINKDGKVSIFILEENKGLIMDKNYENSVFSNLFIKNKSDNYLKRLYKNKKVQIWKVY